MIKKRCPCCNSKTISLNSIAYKLHVDFKPLYCSNCNCEWNTSNIWSFLTRICWPCLGLFYFGPFVLFIIYFADILLVNSNGTILPIFYNTIVISFPLLIMELLLLLIFPLKCIEDKKD